MEVLRGFSKFFSSWASGYDNQAEKMQGPKGLSKQGGPGACPHPPHWKILKS